MRQVHIVLLLIAFLFMTNGCRATTEERVFVEPKTSRPYRLIVSNHHRPHKKAPILFVLHPYQTEPHVLVNGLSLKRHVAEKRNWILVVPEGERDNKGHRFWNAKKACCAQNATHPPDDLFYLRAVLQDVRRHYAVDENSVFAMGESNGASMAYRWACDKGGDLSAVLCMSGVGPGPNDPPCTPGRKVDVLHIHGDQDENVKYGGKPNGKDAYPSAEQNVKTWARLNGLPARAIIEHDWLFARGAIRKETWRDAKTQVQLWTIIGGRHHIRGLHHNVSRLFDFFDER